ncbi:origin recognition complex subunit 4 [Anthonomus grandis grandis]|uniref:origin recognition complex subunit 4 n=1 Tax=Anthonomus grandis grandis TaxID=2921223 RepID=UPI0021667F2C|nr:origin recognition complex subunit 4 [Anthonomus grandis grandis]
MSSESIKPIRKYLKEKIVNNQEFVGKEKELNQVLDLLKKTVEHGESNSMLLIGPKGSGKTKLVNSVLKQLEILKNFKQDSIVVKLHGLIHTDDRLALKAITFQMNLDNAVDGKVFGSFAENLAFLLACLKTGDRHSSKSIIFILEEFDLFCTHHNQTLLYNLFDISQSAQAPICVLGITCRIDVIQLLEKRVKSRFSHRQMFLYSGPEEKSEISDIDFALNRIKWYLEIPNKAEIKISTIVRDQWNSHIQSLIVDKKFRNVIERLIDIDLNENMLRNILVKCIFALSDTQKLFTHQHFEKELNLMERDNVVQILQDLSVLELCLIVAMKHHNEIYDNSPMNFEMIYSRYVKFANKHATMQNVQRPVVMKAFEHIENLELISMINQNNSKLHKEYQFFKLLVTAQQVSDSISKSVGLPTEVIQWSNSSLL